MPLARIVTLHPESTSALSQQLQQHGFTVELAHPEDSPAHPADLEVQFEVCDQRQVLNRAAELAAQIRTEIVVFPNTVQAPPKPVPVQAAQFEEVRKPQPIAAPPAAPAAIQAAVPLHETATPEEEFSYELPGESGNFFSNLGAGLRKSMQQAGSAFASFKSKAASRTESLTGTAREYQERLKLRAAQARAEREQRLAELERQRAEARQKAALMEQEREKEHQLELERQRIEREQRLAELERQRIEAIERAAAMERERQRQIAVHPAGQPLQRTEEPIPQQRPIPRPQSKATRRKQGQLNGVLTGAIAMSFLFLIGLTLSNFRPGSALPADVTQPKVEQDVPFGSATVHGAQPQPRPVIQQPVRPQVQAQQAPTPAAPVASQKSHPQRRRLRSRRGEADDVADDVVVRHFNTQKPQPQHRQQAGLKRYSDM